MEHSCFLFSFLAWLFYVGEPCCDDAEQWHKGADLEYEFDACAVGEPAEKCRAYASEAEHKAEEYAGNHSYFVGHEVGGIDYYGGECRGYDKAYYNGESNGPCKVDVGQCQGEGRGAEYG